MVSKRYCNRFRNRICNRNRYKKKFGNEIVKAQDYATKKMIGICPKFGPKSSYLTKLGGEG